MSKDELRQRREALQMQLDELRQKHERAFRANSDALARQRLGVTDHDAAEMKEFADDEVAGDSAMSDLRREIKLIDEELSGDLAHKGGRVMRWLRK
jgi:hypothetical protein